MANKVLEINVKLSIDELSVIAASVENATLKGSQARLVAGVLDKVDKAGETLHKKVEAAKELEDANKE